MGFTIEVSSAVEEVTDAGHGDEIMLFGRALEMADENLKYQYQMKLPLFLANERCVVQ